MFGKDQTVNECHLHIIVQKGNRRKKFVVRSLVHIACMAMIAMFASEEKGTGIICYFDIITFSKWIIRRL